MYNGWTSNLTIHTSLRFPREVSHAVSQMVNTQDFSKFEKKEQKRKYQLFRKFVSIRFDTDLA
jgi:hypothetical protein